MTKGKTVSKWLTVSLLCIFVVAAGLGLATTKAEAKITQTHTPQAQHKYESGQGTNLKIKDMVPNVQVLGEALLIGENQMMDRESKDGLGAFVNIKSVVDSEGDKYEYYIQGQWIDPRWISTDNMQHLYNLYNSPISGQGYADNSRVGWPSNASAQEFICREGTKYQVVAYDDEWVTIWSDGLKGYSGINARQCYAYMLLRTHQAGFYRVERDKVYLNLYAEEEVAPNRYYSGIGQVTAYNLRVFPKPGDTGSGNCYAYTVNSEMYVVDPTPIPSQAEGDTATYYKVLFCGSNDTNYMGHKYYYGYMNSAYINYKGSNPVTPAGSSPIKVYPKSGNWAKLYEAKDTASASPVEVSIYTRLHALPEGTDDQWAAVQYSGRTLYIQKQDIQYTLENLKVYDINKDNEYVIGWDPIGASAEVKIYSGDKILAKGIFSKNTATIGNKWFDKVSSGAYLKELKVTVGVKGSSATPKEITLKKLPKRASVSGTAENNRIIVNAKATEQVQYATKKDFSNAKTIKGKKKGSVTIKNLKKNTTYYVRIRLGSTIETANGNKLLYGDWSPVRTFKTTNIKVYTPTLKSVKGGKKAITAKWTKPKKGKIRGYEVMVATNKKFTKNVKTFTISSPSKLQWTFKGLKAKKTYYVKIRGYWPQSTNVYSSWSKVKTVKVK
ncbi:MAG: fibronectin type III domain-containing protein [Firmicutes bacterium]|nr:fibronectin type III domain-containing protein [Bacillota bacterium]